MKFIVALWGNWHRQWQLIQRAAPEADKLGYWGFVIPDHYMWSGYPNGNSTLDTWITLTYLAAKTEKIQLGTVVTPIPLRPPSILAKMVATLDVISNGRVILGVGAGWSKTEFKGYSQWDEPNVRVDKTKEGLELILKLWQSDKGGTSSKVSFNGKYYLADNAVLDPKPVQKPHPLLMFGGLGARMLRLAGRYADICLIPPWIDREFEDAKAIVLEETRRHSRENKISFAAIPTIAFEQVQRTIMSSDKSSSQYDSRMYAKGIEQAEEYGCKYVIIPFPFESFIKSMSDFALQIMPSFVHN
ncbi:luciferase-like monooxygenase family protein [Candidatus Nitrososphaera gargensis Ga9.2]|uniref:Luciferase-like monooxygenase family protein n=1 Tax=Nitrososphaera gargensis (strain Ga9.2) TaxID=1237085 RepID=K0IHT3_NITGG|nr:LLM class flavin-dependent oxidoreductase [Candidatus Nitrososphaera gargensis]AFU59500.1 luciferase-like monooxygenase family protein [Candidatus Nitrososphaera gargensis Ga9.2]